MTIAAWALLALSVFIPAREFYWAWRERPCVVFDEHRERWVSARLARKEATTKH